MPELPRDLAEVPDKVLMRLFSMYVQWNNYIDVMRVEAEIAEADAETKLKAIEATSMVAGWTGAKEDRVTIQRAERDLDPAVIEARDNVQLVYARRKLLAVLSNNMERGAALLSRELSRRIGRAPVEGRQARWNP